MHPNSNRNVLYNHKKNVRLSSQSEKMIDTQSRSLLKELQDQNSKKIKIEIQQIDSLDFKKKTNIDQYSPINPPIKSDVEVQQPQYVRKVVYSRSPIRSSLLRNSFTNYEDNYVNKSFANPYENRQSYIEENHDMNDSVFFNKTDINENVRKQKQLSKSFFVQGKNQYQPEEESQLFILREKIRFLEEENLYLKNKKPEIIHTYQQEKIETKIEMDKEKFLDLENKIEKLKRQKLEQEIQYKNQYQQLNDQLKQLQHDKELMSNKLETSESQKELLKEQMKNRSFNENQNQNEISIYENEIEFLKKKNFEQEILIQQIQSKFKNENIEQDYEKRIELEKTCIQLKSKILQQEKEFERLKRENSEKILEIERQKNKEVSNLKLSEQIIKEKLKIYEQKDEGQSDDASIQRRNLSTQISQKHINIQNLESEMDRQRMLIQENIQGKEDFKKIQINYENIMKEKQELIKIQDELINKLQGDVSYQEKTIYNQHKEIGRFRNIKNQLEEQIKDIENELHKKEEQFKVLMQQNKENKNFELKMQDSQKYRSLFQFKIFKKFSNKGIKMRQISRDLKLIRNRKSFHEKKQESNIDLEIKNENQKLFSLNRTIEDEKTQLKNQIQELENKIKQFKEKEINWENEQKQYKEKIEEINENQLDVEEIVQNLVKLYQISKVYSEYLTKKCRSCKRIQDKIVTDDDVQYENLLCQKCLQNPSTIKVEYFIQDYQNLIENQIVKIMNQESQQNEFKSQDISRSQTPVKNEPLSFEMKNLQHDFQKTKDELKLRTQETQDYKNQNKNLKIEIEQLEDYKEKYDELYKRVNNRKSLILNHVQKIKILREGLITSIKQQLIYNINGQRQLKNQQKQYEQNLTYQYQIIFSKQEIII